MGVYHLAPVGTSPGAVTSALAYLKHNKDKPEFKVRGEIVEAVVLFPSWEVREGREGTPEECILNEYEQEKKRREWGRGTAVMDIIRDFMEREFEQNVTLFCCPVNANEYHDCFDKIAKVVLKFGTGTGKHMWANLTGGTNVVNGALLEVAFLSGLLARLYYTFLSNVGIYGRYLQPPSSTPDIFSWEWVPFAKTVFDQTYYSVLEAALSDPGWIEDKEILSRAKNSRPLQLGNISLSDLRESFLNKMHGRQELEREILPNGTATNRNRISLHGREVLERIDSSLFQMLVNPAKRDANAIDQLTKDIELRKL